MLSVSDLTKMPSEVLFFAGEPGTHRICGTSSEISHVLTLESY